MKQHKTNPCHTNEIVRIRKITGQLVGVQKMIEANRYCPEILAQIKAIEAATKSLKTAILEKHLAHCVQEALQSKNQSHAKTKIIELSELLKKW